MERAHSIVAHPEMVKDDVACYLCNCTLKNPVRLPNCRNAHAAFFCLACFLAKYKNGKMQECPICLADLTELHLRLGKEEGFQHVDMRKADLEMLIDDQRADQAIAHELGALKQKYQSDNEATLAKIRGRNRKAMVNEISRLVESERLALKSAQLNKDTVAAKANLERQRGVRASHRAKLKLKVTKSRELPSKKHSNYRHDRSRSVSSLDLFKKMDRDARIARENQMRLVALKAERNADADAKKRMIAHKQWQFEQRSHHIQAAMKEKLAMRQAAAAASKEAAQLRTSEAQQRLKEIAEQASQQHQEKAIQAEERIHRLERQKFEEMQAAAYAREIVNNRRQHMLVQHVSKQAKTAEELRTRLRERDIQQKKLKEAKARQREQDSAQKNKALKIKLQRCAIIKEQERAARLQRADEMELQNATILEGRRAEKIALREEAYARNKEISARSASSRMLRRLRYEEEAVEKEKASISRLADAEKRRSRLLALSMKKKKDCLEAITLRKQEAQNLPVELRSAKRLEFQHQYGSKKIQKIKPIPKQQTSSSPRPHNSKKNEEVLIRIESLRKRQRHQMALILDEEEKKERERTIAIRRSLPRNRAQVAKHFSFLRSKAVERITLLNISHQQTIDAMLCNLNADRRDLST